MTHVAATSERTAEVSAGPHRFRPDIEGLRAVAVVLVICDHFWKFPAGGFVGVDVFYVISGFLITSLLLREFTRTGTISFAGFYVRRVRRIVPVAVVVVLVTVVVAYVVWFRPRADQTAADAVAALMFVSNWHLIRLGTDYLQATGPVSPLQHYWSLAVEEQFYVFWPPLLLLVLVVCARRRRSLPQTVRIVTVMVTLGVVLSFVWSCYLSATRPAVAYFESFSRAWELGVGVLVAIYLFSVRTAISSRIASTATFGALAVLIGSSVFIDPSTTFPGPWAAIPVLCAAAIILSGSAAASWSKALIVNGVSRYLGRISYSLYLWHFPVVVFVTAVDLANPWVTALVSLAVTMFLSAASFHFVEEPIRRSTWLSGMSGGRGRTSQIVIPVVVGLFLVSMAMAQYFIPAASNGRQLAGAVGVAPENPAVASQEFDSADDVQVALGQAVASTDWPRTDPSLDVVGPANGAPAMDPATGCRNDVGAAVVHYCDAGPADATGTAVVIGDSVAASWMPAVEGALVPSGWRVRGLTFASCAVADVDAYPRVRTSTFLGRCADRRAEMIDWAVDSEADLIVVANDQGTFTRQADGSQGAGAASQWDVGLQRSIVDLQAGGARVVVLSNPPLGADVTSCATRLEGPLPCLASIDADYGWKADAERDAAGATGATFVDTRSWFCTADGLCPAFAGSSLIRTDSTHLTGRFAAELAPVLGPVLVGAG